MTPDTTDTPFATLRELTTLVDWRVVADCVSDAPNRVSRRAVRDPSHPAGAAATMLLLRATGAVLKYAQAGKKYTPADLEALAGAGRMELVGLTVGLALLYTTGRRYTAQDLAKRIPLAAEAQESAQALRKGEVVFGLLEATEAAQMDAGELYSETQIGGRIVSRHRRFFGRAGGDS